jgi:hypothetical protein
LLLTFRPSFQSVVKLFMGRLGSLFCSQPISLKTGSCPYTLLKIHSRNKIKTLSNYFEYKYLQNNHKVVPNLKIS